MTVTPRIFAVPSEYPTRNFSAPFEPEPDLEPKPTGVVPLARAGGARLVPGAPTTDCGGTSDASRPTEGRGRSPPPVRPAAGAGHRLTGHGTTCPDPSMGHKPGARQRQRRRTVISVAAGLLLWCPRRPACVYGLMLGKRTDRRYAEYFGGIYVLFQCEEPASQYLECKYILFFIHRTHAFNVIFSSDRSFIQKRERG